MLAPTDGEADAWPARGYHQRGAHATELFWNDLRFISAINVLGLPGAVVPCNTA